MPRSRPGGHWTWALVATPPCRQTHHLGSFAKRDALAATDRVSWFSQLARRAVWSCSSARRSARYSRFATDTRVRRLAIPSLPRMFAPSVAGGIQTFAARLPMRYLLSDFSPEITNDNDVAKPEHSRQPPWAHSVPLHAAMTDQSPKQSNRRWGWFFLGCIVGGILIGIREQFHPIWLRAAVAGCGMVAIGVATYFFQKGRV